MSLYDGIILDLDGTLWNAASATAKGWNSVIQNLGIPTQTLQEKDIERVTGQPFVKCVEMLYPREILEDHPKLMEWLAEGEREAVTNDGGDFYDGLLEGIPRLSKNCPLFIVSNCQDWYLGCFFKHSKLRNFFQDVDCYGHSRNPKSEMIKRMAEKHNLYNPIYIGDTLSDREASDLAKVDFGYAEYGFGELSDENIRFPSFNSVVEYFCTSG